MADFETMSPQDISSEKATIEFLVLRQIDRTNYLASISRSTKINPTDVKNLLYSIRDSQARLEAMLWPYLEKDTEYHVKIEEINERLGEKQGQSRKIDYGLDGQENFIIALNDWNKLLMLKLRETGLFPRKKKTYEFEE